MARKRKSKRYLLDTNILVHQIRDDATGAFIRERYNLLVQEPKPLLSVVSDGELRSLIFQFGWGPARIEQALFLLGYFDRILVADENLFPAYAFLDASSRRLGFRMGKNDLWIAATAYVTGATLLTTDADFDHLPQALFAHERVPVVP